MMGGSADGLLDPSPRAGRGGDNTAVVTCTSMVSSNFVSTAVLDISRKVTAVKEVVDGIDVGLPPELSTCPLHTNGGCGKERRICIGPW